jgi:hypothetical protein
MLSLHAIGLAIVVGIFTMFNFRVLGLFKSIEYSAFLDFFKLAWAGLLINAGSGFALFCSQATFYITNTPFLVKISSIFIGSILAFRIQSNLRLNAEKWDSKVAEPGSKDHLYAQSSLLFWACAIFGGRLIAYL